MRYRLRLRLARGGFGEVWLGAHVGPGGFQRPVVLKRAVANGAIDLATAERALVDEACVAAGLSHPNVVHVYELVRTEHGTMLAMEYLHGMSLRALLREREAAGPLPTGVCLRIGADVARALAYAHGAFGPGGEALAVVHRDVSPENVVVCASGVTKLIDFGAARSDVGDTIDEKSDAGAFGKRAYAAPERLAGERGDSSSDVYSLGAVLREALGDRPDVPAPVADLIKRMTVRDPSRRTVRAEQAADLFEAVAGELGVQHADVARMLSLDHGERLARASALVADALAEGGGLDVVSQTDTGAVSIAAAIDTLVDAAPRTAASGTSHRE
jgi:serine/threonine-protein kinase